jgi:competence protein ComEA
VRNVFAFLLLGHLLLAGVVQAAPESASSPLDLNRATAAQLESLPGIGAVKAAAILAVRDSQGGFQSMEELEAVRGIGPALVAKLRPLVVLGTQSTKPSKSGKTALK